jgi:hypothetical protein
MIFDISNPSDPYLMEAPDLEVAAVAVALLGEGKYGLDEVSMETGREVENGVKVPIFLLGGIQEWFQASFNRSLEEVLKHVTGARTAELVACFRGITLGSAKDRIFYLSALSKIDDPEKKAAFAAEWDDKKRSSMNNIGARAQRLAEHFSKKKEEAA